MTLYESMESDSLDRMSTQVGTITCGSTGRVSETCVLRRKNKIHIQNIPKITTSKINIETDIKIFE